jgi:signal transduction histidine kinase
LAFDTAFSILFTVAVIAITRNIAEGDVDYRALDGLAYACVAVSGLSLALRRRFPLSVLAVSTGAMTIYALRDYSGGPVYLGPILAMYTVGTAYPRRVWMPAVVASVGTISVVGAVMAPDTPKVLFHLVYFTWGIGAGFVGDAGQSRREYLLGLEERARYLEESREEEARRMLAEERLRIARDLHDIVAHSLASINVQAGAGAHVGRAHPDQAVHALLAIKAASKDALEELRATLGMLRASDDETAPRAPVPTLARLDALVDRTEQAGLPVTVSVTGRVEALPAAVDAAAYRIVQESLTNALRHGGPDARAAVAIEFGPDSVEIDVTDTGLGAAAVNGASGHGITGMRERAAGLGGSLAAAPAPGGGYHVHAVLPTRVETDA